MRLVALRRTGRAPAGLSEAVAGLEGAARRAVLPNTLRGGRNPQHGPVHEVLSIWILDNQRKFPCAIGHTGPGQGRRDALALAREALREGAAGGEGRTPEREPAVCPRHRLVRLISAAAGGEQHDDGSHRTPCPHTWIIASELEGAGGLPGAAPSSVALRGVQRVNAPQPLGP